MFPARAFAQFGQIERRRTTATRISTSTSTPPAAATQIQYVERVWP
ncbi:hypothetical protein [Kribbella sp. DT2]